MDLARSAVLSGIVTVFAVLPSAGCTSKAVVTGTVTFEGKKLDKGYITFYPATERGDVKGATAETRGAEVCGGAYRVEGLSPGKRKVVISVPPKLTAQKSSDPLRPPVKASPPEPAITPKTRGNSQVVEIHGGVQALDFDLRQR